MGGALFINPGSSTGAYSMVAHDPVPSFVLMNINGSAAVIYVYELVPGQTDEESPRVKVDKLFYNRAMAPNVKKALGAT